MTYTSAHFNLAQQRGRAVEHVCTICGGPARDWAYQYNGDPELYSTKGAPYSEDPSCYEPLCRKCHRNFDLAHSQRLRELFRELGLNQVVLLAEMRESDPDFAAKMKYAGQRLGQYSAERRKTDPDFDKKMREVGRKNILAALAHTESRMGDPEFAAKVSQDRANAARQANRIKRTCTPCGLTAHPAAIGAHQKGSGHVGYTDER